MQYRCSPKRILATVVVLAVLAMVSGCSWLDLLSDASRDVGGNGGGGSSSDFISFSIGPASHLHTANIGAGYDPDDDSTCIVGSDAMGQMAQNAIHIYFPGDSTGTFASPPGTPEIGVFWIGILIDYEYYEWRDGDCSFTINVTTYGPVGGRIEGTFSGTLKNDSDDTIVVTNGQFSVTRYASIGI